MRLRKDVNVYVFDPKAKFFNLAVELEDVPGALLSVLRTLQNMRVNILGSFSSVDRHTGTGTWSAFVEDSGYTPSDFKEQLSSSPHVLDVIAVESKDGFLVDGMHFPLTFNTGDRAFFGTAKYISRMFAAMREEFGTGGETIVYNEGYTCGRDVWLGYLERMGPEFVRSHLEAVLKVYQAVGWFEVDATKLDELNKSVTVRAGGCFECEGKRSDTAYSNFVRGHLAGGLGVIFGTDMSCEETSCIATGAEACEFQLSPKQVPQGNAAVVLDR